MLHTETHETVHYVQLVYRQILPSLPRGNRRRTSRTAFVSTPTGRRPQKKSSWALRPVVTRTRNCYTSRMTCPVCSREHPPHHACRPVDIARAQDARRRGAAPVVAEAKRDVRAAEKAVSDGPTETLAELKAKLAAVEAEKAAKREATRKRVAAWRASRRKSK